MILQPRRQPEIDQTDPISTQTLNQLTPVVDFRSLFFPLDFDGSGSG